MSGTSAHFLNVNVEELWWQAAFLLQGAQTVEALVSPSSPCYEGCSIRGSRYSIQKVVASALGYAERVLFVPT